MLRNGNKNPMLSKVKEVLNGNFNNLQVTHKWRVGNLLPDHPFSPNTKEERENKSRNEYINVEQKTIKLYKFWKIWERIKGGTNIILTFPSGYITVAMKGKKRTV